MGGSGVDFCVRCGSRKLETDESSLYPPQISENRRVCQDCGAIQHLL